MKTLEKNAGDFCKKLGEEFKRLQELHHIGIQ